MRTRARVRVTGRSSRHGSRPGFGVGKRCTSIAWVKRMNLEPPYMTDVPADEVHEIAESSASSASSTTRRQFMLAACASAAARAFAAAAGFGAPFGLSPAFAYAPPAGGGLDAFLALSQQLTGRTSFDATLGKRVYDALATADSQ